MGTLERIQKFVGEHPDNKLDSYVYSKTHIVNAIVAISLYYTTHESMYTNCILLLIVASSYVMRQTMIAERVALVVINNASHHTVVYSVSAIKNWWHILLPVGKSCVYVCAVVIAVLCVYVYVHACVRVCMCV